MSVQDAITAVGIKTGDYTVTRTVAGSYAGGLYTPGSTSSFSIEASVQPVTGRDLKVLPEGHHSEEMVKIFTKTELKTRSPGFDPDKVAIGGETYEVKNVQAWTAFGGKHYEVLAARQVIP